VPTPNESVIDRFYGALAAGDGDGAAACYAPDARFSDPVFTDLRGEEPGAMWRMLAKRSSDLRIELLERSASEDADGGGTGSAHWRAYYTFSQTGRKVVNDIRASLRFADGQIVEHRDTFDLYKWARQALGPVGVVLGWTPLMQVGIRRRARASLDEFVAKEAKE
jgi:ketosteroid isomerase-like protein